VRISGPPPKKLEEEAAEEEGQKKTKWHFFPRPLVRGGYSPFLFLFAG
jgi:hypothetical protein